MRFYRAAYKTWPLYFVGGEMHIRAIDLGVLQKVAVVLVGIPRIL